MLLLNAAPVPNSARIDEGVPNLPRWMCRCAFTLVSTALVSACLDPNECNSGEVQCDANRARNCQTSDRLATWETEDCGTNVCVIAKRVDAAVAFCALSADLDQRCREADVPNCADGNLVECSAGYATSIRTCASGCLTLDDYPDRCVGEMANDIQRCPVDGYECAMASGLLQDEVVTSAVPTPAGVCSENTLAPRSGYVTYAQRCEAGSIVARTRCSRSCGMLADCSSACL